MLNRRPLKRRALGVCFLILIALATSLRGADRPPNVVLILVDDLGWMDLSCQGSDYFRTPHIDSLAASGIRFTDAYAACAVCSPTRAAVMTGRYPARTGVTDWIRARFQRPGRSTPDSAPTEYVGNPRRKLLCPPNPFWLEHEEVTLAEMLQAQGYRSAHIGKWHLGDPAWYPPSQGFDINVAGCDIGQPPSYFDPYTHPRYNFDGQLSPRREGEFLTHREGSEAQAFIQAHRDKPFFLFYCPYAVHTPIQAIQEVAAKYQRPGKKPVQSKYAAMVESVDDAVGMILESLRAANLEDDTLVIFTSDNGGLLGPTDNAPLRSGKGYAYEGGIRVPLIVRWPGTLPAGRTSSAAVSSIDLLPTVLELTGQPQPGHELDGVSLASHLRSGGEQTLAPRNLIWHFPHYRHAPGPYSIIRQGNWKLIHWYEGPQELYELQSDLGEAKNLATVEPTQRAKLEQALLAELASLGARMPRENPDYQPSQK